ncbi:MAG TPA: hypothetical protein DCZ71_01915 [Ruminococcus sp.]|nr:hypothetical protein [Ruminococcus sp.]
MTDRNPAYDVFRQDDDGREEEPDSLAITASVVQASDSKDEVPPPEAAEPAKDGAAAVPDEGGTGAGAVLLVILISLLAVSLLAGVIISFNRRNSIYNEVNAKTSALNLAEAENVRLQSELESKMSAKNVEDYAENVLHMTKIDASQIKYIKIQTEDVVSIPEQDDGLLTKIKDFLSDCVEYFRG